MKKYKVWLHIEEIDEDEDHYQDLEEHTESIGPEFNTPEEAIKLKERLIDCVTDDGEFIYVPPKIIQHDLCPQCKEELMSGPNGSTICSGTSCSYWRE